MKDLFRAADDLYKAGLNMVNRLNDIGFEKLRPQTRAVLVPLTEALQDYERSRFRRRKVIIEFYAPMPARQITRRELTGRPRSRRLQGSVRLNSRDKKTDEKNGEPTES